MQPVIDSHIHFDRYKEKEQDLILESLAPYNIQALISVSNHLESSKKNLKLARRHKHIHPAFGYHPEQRLPSAIETERLTEFIIEHEREMVAIGEVGLPYYLKQQTPEIEQGAYIELLEHFIILAKKLDKPIILHAVYDDAPIVCSLLENHSLQKVHFHWFKGNDKTIERLKANGYFISITPDVLYKTKIQRVVRQYPLTKLMVETDGPWQFEGPFKHQMTQPKLIHESIKTIAEIKGITIQEVYDQIYENTANFYLDRS